MLVAETEKQEREKFKKSVGTMTCPYRALVNTFCILNTIVHSRDTDYARRRTGLPARSICCRLRSVSTAGYEYSEGRCGRPGSAKPIISRRDLLLGMELSNGPERAGCCDGGSCWRVACVGGLDGMGVRGSPTLELLDSGKTPNAECGEISPAALGPCDDEEAKAGIVKLGEA